MIALKKDYRASNDVISAMIEDELLELDENGHMTLELLQKMVIYYAKNTKRMALSSPKIRERLMQLGASMAREKLTLDGVRKGVYHGVKLGSEAESLLIEEKVTDKDAVQGDPNVIRYISVPVVYLLGSVHDGIDKAKLLNTSINDDDDDDTVATNNKSVGNLTRVK